MKLTKGSNLSMWGLSFVIRGMMGYSLIVFGAEGCMRGKFKDLVQDCFLNFTKVCGIFLYFMFHSYRPSNYPNLSITYISSILLSIFYPSVMKDSLPMFPSIRMLSSSKSLLVIKGLLVGRMKLDLSEP